MKQWLLVVFVMAVAGCNEASAPDPDPIQLAGTMNVAADTIVVSLRLTNTSGVAQVIAWQECLTAHAANMAVFFEAALRNRLWEQQRLPAVECPNVTHQDTLQPNELYAIQGERISVEQILGDSIPEGLYHIAIRPLTLRARPQGSSNERAIEGTIRVGSAELRRADNSNSRLTFGARLD